MTYRMRMSGKHPSVSRPYDFDATNLLALSGATITSATVVASPASLTIGSPVIDNTLHTVRVRVSGGTDGVEYAATCTMSLSDGGTEVIIMVIPVDSTGG